MIQAFVLLVALQGEDFASRWSYWNQRAQQAGAARDALKLVEALGELDRLAPGNARIVAALAAAKGLPASLPMVGAVTEAREERRIGGQDWIVEDVAWDGRRFLLSSVRRGVILDEKGEVFAKVGMAVFGLGVDRKRKLLWAATGPAAQCRECRTETRGALVGFDLTTGREVKRVVSPLDSELSDLAVARNGDVYVSSNSGGALFVLRVNQGVLERLDTAGELPSPQSPAVSADGKTLYLADYRRGIASVDLKTRKWSWLRPGAGVIVNGIDGLYVIPKGFVAVQNGVAPQRVVLFSRTLDTVRVLESGWKGLGEPTHGTVVGKRFCFIANSGWDAFDEKGKRREGVPPVESTIYCRPLP